MDLDLALFIPVSPIQKVRFVETLQGLANYWELSALQEKVNIEIGGFVSSITCDQPETAQFFNELYAGFVTQTDAVDIDLRVHSGGLPDVAGWEIIFDSKGPWKLLSFQGQLAIQRSSPALTPNVYQVSIFNQTFRDGDIYLADVPNSERQFFYDFVLQLIHINLLSKGYGLMVHAAAVDNDGKGCLFIGHSGAGKSTLSALWAKSGRGHVLCDDRVIVRKQGDSFWVYGTPWSGTARIASQRAAPLERLFILRQANQNKAVKLSPVDAASRVLSRAFPTYWDMPGMAFTLDFLSELCQAVPCYDLAFRPEPDAIDYLQCLKLE